MQPNPRGSASSAAAAAASAAAGGEEMPAAARWTHEEEERLLRIALQISREPVASFDATVSPVERVRQAVAGDFTPKEIVRKTKELRQRYEEMRLRCGTGRGEAYADVFSAAYELSDQIWGANGEDKEKENGKEGERIAA